MAAEVTCMNLQIWDFHVSQLSLDLTIYCDIRKKGRGGGVFVKFTLFLCHCNLILLIKCGSFSRFQSGLDLVTTAPVCRQLWRSRCQNHTQTRWVSFCQSRLWCRLNCAVYPPSYQCHHLHWFHRPQRAGHNPQIPHLCAKLGSGQSELWLSHWQHGKRHPLQVCPPHNCPWRQFWWGATKLLATWVAFSAGQPSCTELEVALVVDEKEYHFSLSVLCDRWERRPLSPSPLSCSSLLHQRLYSTLTIWS